MRYEKAKGKYPHVVFDYLSAKIKKIPNKEEEKGDKRVRFPENKQPRELVKPRMMQDHC